MKEMVELDEVDWKRVYALYRKLNKINPNHEYVKVVDEVGYLIHEVRTMRNYVDSHYFSSKRKFFSGNERKAMRKDETWYRYENTEKGNLARNCRRLNNIIENVAVKHMMRLLEKYG